MKSLNPSNIFIAANPVLPKKLELDLRTFAGERHLHHGRVIAESSVSHRDV